METNRFKQQNNRPGAKWVEPVMLVLISAALLFALGIQIVVPILAWRWSQQPFVGALLSHRLVVLDPVEVRWAGMQAGLNAPDRLVAVNGQVVRNQCEFESALAAYSIGDPVVLTIEEPGDSIAWMRRDVVVELSPFPVIDFVIRFVIPCIVSLCYLCVGTWAFWRYRAVRQARALALYCASASVLIAATFDAMTTHVLLRIWMAAFSASSLALMWLAFSFATSILARRKWGQGVVVVLALLLLVWSQVALDGTDPRAYGCSWLANYVFIGLGVVVFVLVLLHIWRHSFHYRIRLQVQVLLLGVTASFVPAGIWLLTMTLSWLLPSVGRILPFHMLVNVPPMVLFPLSVGYAIYQYQFMAVDQVFNLFYHSRPDVRAALQDFSRDLTASLDSDFVIERLLACVGQIFQPHYACVYMLNPDGFYELGAAWGQADESALRTVRFSRQGAVASRLQREEDGLNLAAEGDAGWLAQLQAQERESLARLNAVLLMPLRSQDRLLGILLLGPGASGNLYASEEIDLLSTIVDQAAISAANARLYAQQVEQGRYLVRQTRQLTDILSLGNRIKSLELDVVAQSTVEAVQQSVGFDLVTLSLIDDDDPARVRVAAWAGTRNPTWEKLTASSFPLIDFDDSENVTKLGYCYLAHAPGNDAQISSPQREAAWQEGDQLYVPLTSNEGLFGYLTVDHPRDGLRPAESTLEMLEIFANQAAIAIQNANLYAGIEYALDERLDELSTLQEIDRQINAKLDFEHVINTTLDWAVRVTSAVAGTLALRSPDGQSLRIVAHQGYPEELGDYWDVPWPISEGIVGRVVQTGEPALVEDIGQDADYVDTLASVRSHLSVPIKRQAHVIGVLTLESAERGGFSANDMAFLMRLADHATIAIENAGLYNQTQSRIAELEALQQISLDLSSQLELSAVLDSIAANAQQLVNANYVVLYLYDTHQDVLSFGAGLSPQGSERQPPIPIAENRLSKTVAQKGEAIVIGDTAGHEMIPVERWPIGAIASIPLRATAVLGVFDVAFDHPHVFTTDELRVLNVLANQAAIAIKNAQLYADVQRANDAKNEFVGIVSRELKTPLTSIQGYTRMLALGAGGEISDKQREFLDVVLDHVDRMSDLVADLLDSSRIEAGRVQFSPRAVAVAKLVDDAVKAVRAQIDARHHELTVDVPADLPRVHVDPGRIVQALVNLLSNAYKYTLDGGQIKVWAECRDRDTALNEQWVVCAVSDSGIGILPQDQEHLFQQFFRVRDPQTINDTGVGLGLAVTRNIIELHGGRIWVQSAYGRGSTFYFTLPVAEHAGQ